MLRSKAHLALGGIRLFNGVFALFAPRAMCRRMGIDPEANPSAIYPLRMFGVRTIILGLELLVGRTERRRERLDTAVLIHASDTAAAATAGLRGHLPPRVGILATGISALNTLFAILARRPRPTAAQALVGRYRRRGLARRVPWLAPVASRVPVVRDLLRLS